MDTKPRSTREVARLLSIHPSTLSQALWDGRIPAPQKGPGGAFWWDETAIYRAAKVFHVLPSTIQQRIAAADGQEVGK
ncbi:MAG: hypothetical protein NTU94_08890 [Planctomycetota bacterium]|nr:hypothetical protein [Planctomycetota bacterium]